METPEVQNSHNPGIARGHALDAVKPVACGAEKRDGTVCAVRPVAGYARCWFHEPALADTRRAAQTRGGYAATMTRVLPPDTPRPNLGTSRDVQHLLEDVTHAVLTGQIAPAIANSVKGLADVAIRIAELQAASDLAAIEQELAQLSERP